ncbi:MAG: hypothetical protein EXQ98_00870 [Alphaproteobacteria bacterium]|nr:hypothetical protein [Alphaproteobacteria bacterium]
MGLATWRHKGRALLLGAILLGAPMSAQADHRQAFVGGVEDLPLMDGLAEDRAAGLVFDKPDGRLVDAYASGSVSPEAVGTFYKETLPELGWRVVGPLIFEREGERLSIEIEGSASEVLVRFHLAPR